MDKTQHQGQIQTATGWTSGMASMQRAKELCAWCGNASDKEVPMKYSKIQGFPPNKAEQGWPDLPCPCVGHKTSFPSVPPPVLPMEGSCPTWGQWLLWGRQVLEYSANLICLWEVSTETSMFSFPFLPSSFAYQSLSGMISRVQTGTGFLYQWLCCTPNFKLSCTAVIKMAPFHQAVEENPL